MQFPFRAYFLAHGERLAFDISHLCTEQFRRIKCLFQMSLIDWAEISPWVHMSNFSPVSEMRKGQRSWGPVFDVNFL